MKYFETRFKYSESRKQLWPYITKYLQKFIPKNSNILELACGYGDFINNINCNNKYAIDINNSLDFLEHNIKFKQIDLIKIDFYKDFENKNINVIFMSNFLEHLDDSELDFLFININKILRINDLIIILQPNYKNMIKEYFDDYTHKKIFTDISIVDFLSSKNFQTIHIEKKFLPSSFKKSIFPLWMSKILLKIYFKLPFRIGGQMLIVAKKMI